MPPIHDLLCQNGHIEENVPVVDRPYPACKCGAERDWMPTKVTTHEWGQSRYYRSLDRTFGSKSELKQYMKEHHAIEAGDKVGGARNTDHLNLGKSFSFAGQTKRGTSPLAK